MTPKETTSPVLDLHGMTVQQAHQSVIDHVTSNNSKHKWVTIITGKSGVIRSEAESWLSSQPGVSSVTVAKSGGAFMVKFKTNRGEQ
jgi:DNA-nicking Smr family endonuclease